MGTFDDFLSEVLKGVQDLAVGSLKTFGNEIRDDAQAFIAETREKLERWTILLARGDLDEDEFAFLVESQKDLARMSLITAAGIGAARVKRLRDEIIALVIGAAFRTFL